MSATTTSLPSPVPAPWPPPATPSTPPSTPSTAPRRRLHQVVRLALLAAAVSVALLIDRSPLAALAVLFVLVVPLERLYPRRREQRLRRRMLGTDLSFALLSPLLNVAAVAVAVVIGGLSLFWLPGIALRPLVASLPAAVLPVVGFLLFDLVSYWTHRFAHEVPFLWRFHAVHHSPEEMDWVSGFRIHPFDGVLIAPAFFFLIGAGFSPEVAGVLAVLQIVLGIFFHANVRVRWRWLDRVVANPEFHHWHHSSETDAIGHNYGPALPWWDLLFGTYFMPEHRTGRRPQRYGVDEPMPDRLAGQLLHPCRGARRHLWLWRHPVLAIRSLYRATGNLLADLRRSATRPTHSVRRETVTGSRSTNASLVGASRVPLVARRTLPVRR